MGWRELINPWHVAHEALERHAMMSDAHAWLLKERDALVREVHDGDEALVQATEQAQRLERELREAQAAYDSLSTLELKVVKLEVQLVLEKERADWWKSQAEARTPKELETENMARLAAQMNGVVEGEETEAGKVKGLQARINEIFGDGWTPPKVKDESGDDDE